MKKFLIYLVVILVAVSVGFTVFYLVKDNETISISTSNIYMREGDVIDDLEVIYENKKSFSDYDVFSSNEDIAKYDKDRGTLTAVSGGIATITFRTTNVKFRNLSCQVYVGDGSITSPYYIQTAKDLREIGAFVKTGETTSIKYGVDKCYKLVNNINLAEGHSATSYWVPIGTGNEAGFTGNFDGNGYTISNVNVNKQEYIAAVNKIENFTDDVSGYREYVDAGLFSKIGVNGRVCNLKVDNVNISGSYNNGTTLGNVGIIAGQNYGTIERVEIILGNIDVTDTIHVGGITGANISSENSVEITDDAGVVTRDYYRYTARIDRCIANVKLGIDKDYVDGEIKGVSKIVGGLAGKNDGGIIIYSYSKGEAHLNSQTTYYGGIVGYNVYANFTKHISYLYDYSGAHIKDCYSLMKLRKVNAINSNALIGGIIGYNYDDVALDLDVNGVDGVEAAGHINKVIGNYYLTENLNFVENTSTINPDDNTTTTPEPTNYIGCGEYRNNGQKVDYPDTDYIIQGKNAVELKLQYTYKSHEEIERIENVDSGEFEIQTTVIPWKFDSIWYFNANLNDGFPTINFANIEVSDDLYDISDGSTIDTVEKLKTIKLDGHYIITADIKFSDSDVWVPIGTMNKPFVGSLKAGAYIENGVKNYYKIYNLKTSEETKLTEIKREELEYAGLFGVTNGEKGGSIENITLVNPIIANGRTVGGIVATNGYVTQIRGKATTFKGLTVENCQIMGGTLRGVNKVGGIVGDNLGTVKTSSAVDYRDDNYNLVSKVQILLYGNSEGYAGGIVGYNSGVITGSRFAEKSNVVAKSGDAVMINVYVGGIAGINNGTISNCSVTSEEGVLIEGLKGSIGGIAGTNQSEINNVVVSTSINAPIANDQVYVGGIAGSIISKSSVKNALVTNTAIRGYNAGGIAGLINYSTPYNYKYQLTVDKNYKYELSDDDKDTVSVVAVDNKTSVEGKLAGGFAAIIDNGIIRNSYTRATLRGVDSKSTKAGFAVDLNLNKTTRDVAIIINCYNACEFSKDNGKNYSVSPREILQNPVLTLGIDALERNAGYCFDSAYLKQDGVTNPINKDGFLNLFVKDPAGANMDALIGTAPKHFIDRKFDQSIWKFNVGAMPTLKVCDSLENSLKDVFDRVFTLTFPEHVVVTRNGSEVSTGTKINKGDVLIITYITTDKYSKTKFTVNGMPIENGEKYTVSDYNVVIEYEEELTHYDVEIAATENGSVNVGGATYIKAGETVTLNITPAGNYVVSIITITKANGEKVPVTDDYKFVMPNEKIKIEVTFKQTFGIVIPENVVVSKGETQLGAGERVLFGEELTVAANPLEGFAVGTLKVATVDGEEITLTDEGKFTMPEKDVVISVTFLRYGTVSKPATVQLVVNDITLAADDKVLEGDAVKLVITPETNYIVDVVTVTATSGAKVEVKNNEFIMPNEDVSIEVTYKLTYSLTMPENVTVVRNETTLTAADRVAEGDILTITYVATEGYRVTNVTINGNAVENDAKYTVQQSDVVIVLTEVKEYDANISDTITNGTVEIDKVKAILGEQLTLQIKANEGFALVEAYYIVENDENQTHNVITGSAIIMPEGNITVFAVFEAIA